MSTARESTGRLAGFGLLVSDRDTKFTASFDAVFGAEGIEVIRSPIRAPPANAICERVIGPIRRECSDRLLIFGRRHLHTVLQEYPDHYNGHRPHRSLGQHRPAGPLCLGQLRPDVTVVCRDRLGGLIHEYDHAA